MRIELFNQSYQFYLLPTIKITYSIILNGNLEINLCWLKGGISIKIKPKQR